MPLAISIILEYYISKLSNTRRVAKFMGGITKNPKPFATYGVEKFGEFREVIPPA